MIRFKMNDMLFIPPHIFSKLKDKHNRTTRSSDSTRIYPYGNVNTLYNKKKTKLYVPYVSHTNFYAQLKGLEKLFGKPLFTSGANI